MTYDYNSYTLREAQSVKRARKNVICKHCGESVSSTIVQLDYLQEKGIIVEGLRCQKCKTTYVISVSDNELRKNWVLAEELRESIEGNKGRRASEFRSFMQIRGFIPEDVKRRWEIKITAQIDTYNKIKKENKSRGDRLKRNYMRGE